TLLERQGRYAAETPRRRGRGTSCRHRTRQPGKRLSGDRHQPPRRSPPTARNAWQRRSRAQALDRQRQHQAASESVNTHNVQRADAPRAGLTLQGAGKLIYARENVNDGGSETPITSIPHASLFKPCALASIWAERKSKLSRSQTMEARCADNEFRRRVTTMAQPSTRSAISFNQ